MFKFSRHGVWHILTERPTAFGRNSVSRQAGGPHVGLQTSEKGPVGIHPLSTGARESAGAALASGTELRKGWVCRQRGRGHTFCRVGE